MTPPVEPPPVEVALYRVDVTGAVLARSWSTTASIWWPRFGPDGETVVHDTSGASDRVRFVHLPSGRLSEIQVPGFRHYAFADWLPDGRFLIGGSQLWIAPTAAAPPVFVVDRFAQLVVPSPSGRSVALWRYAEDRVRVIDLASRSDRAFPDAYRRCAQGGVIFVAWAPDERQLAVSDCADETGAGLRTWIVETATGSRIRSIDGVFVTYWFRDGSLLAIRPGPPRTEPTFYRLASNGASIHALPSVSEVAPDERRAAHTLIRPKAGSADPNARESVAAFVDLATGAVAEVKAGAYAAGWSRTGLLVVVTRP